MNTFEDAYFSSLEAFLVKLGLIFVGLAIIFFIDIKFFLILCAYLLFLSFFNLYFKEKVKSLSKSISDLNSAYSLQVANLFSGMDIIRANKVEEVFLANAGQVFQRQEKEKGKYFFVNGIQDILMGRIGTFSTILALLYVAYRISTNEMGFALAALVIVYVNVVVQNLAESYPDYNRFKANEELINSRILDSSPKEAGTKGEKFNFNTAIEVNDLSFAYQDKEVLSNINLKIQKGNKYLIKGGSGTGKTTLLNILLGFLDKYQGSITVDGKSFRDVDKSNFYEKIGIVSQDVFLFEASLRDNIGLFKDYSQAEMNRAVELSNLSSFVIGLPEGLDTLLIDDGEEISGGEKQRIAIARAIIKNPDIIFADEMTSNLDKEIALQVEKALLNLDSTIVFISHRIYQETQADYDEIIEIEGGRIKSITGDKQ